MADDADAADAEQGSTAVFGVVEAAAELIEGTAGEHGADLGGDGAGEGLAERVADEAADALTGFEGDVADEAVADDDVRGAIEDVAALDVADEVKRECLEERQGFPGEFVALGFFLADGEQADAGAGDLEDAAGIHFTHDGELLEVVRLAVNVGSDVKQDAGIARGGGHGCGEGGAVYAGKRAEDHFCGGHGGAGVAGGDEAGALLLADELEADAHGAVFFGTDGVRSFFVHADALRGVVDDDGQVFFFEVFVEEVAELGFGPNEMHPDRERAAGKNRPPDLGFGCFVGTYCVQRNIDEHGAQSTDDLWSSLL